MLERAARIELAISCLASRRSSAELCPLSSPILEAPAGLEPASPAYKAGTSPPMLRSLRLPGGPGRTRTSTCRVKGPVPCRFGHRPTSTAVVGHRGVEPRPGVYKTPVLTHTPVPTLVYVSRRRRDSNPRDPRALLLSGQALWPLSDVAVHLDGGRPGTRTPTTVSRLGRLATCCLTIRQAFRPLIRAGGGRGIRTPETSRSCPVSNRVPRPAGRPPSYPVAEGEGLEPSDHSRGLLFSGQVPCR